MIITDVTPLDELIEGASGEAPVTTLLRKVKVVASRAGVPALEEWVERELNGYYEQNVELPEYRGPFQSEVLGTFGGAFGSQINNAPIPSGLFPPEYRAGMLFNVTFPQPIVEIEELAHSEETPRVVWPANAVAVVNGLVAQGKMSPIYQGMGLVQAWHSIGTHQFVAIVDAVRNRILDLALTMEKDHPQTGQRDAPSLSEETRQVIVTNIYGNSTNLAVASNNVAQAINFGPGDQDGLSRFLESLGVPETEIESLFVALDADGHVENVLGTRTKAWIGNLMAGAGKIGIGATGGLIADAIAHYLGIG